MTEWKRRGLSARRGGRRRRGGNGHGRCACRDLEDQLEQERQRQGSDTQTEHHAQENNREQEEHVHKTATPPAEIGGWRLSPPPRSSHSNRERKANIGARARQASPRALDQFDDS